MCIKLLPRLIKNKVILFPLFYIEVEPTTVINISLPIPKTKLQSNKNRKTTFQKLQPIITRV